VTALIRSEWLKLRTVRSNVVMISVAILLPVIAMMLTTALMNIENANDNTVPNVVLGSGALSILLFGIVGVLCVTQEYSQGTIRLTLAATPSRLRVFVSKVVVVVLLAMVASSFVLATATIGGRAILSSRGVETPLMAANASSAYGALIAMAAIVSLLGLGIGQFTRNPPSAVAILVLWPLLAEGLVGNLLAIVVGEGLRDWLPFGNGLAATFLDVESLQFGRWGAIGYFAAWSLAVALVAERLFQRRDA
jgi:ABC-2 type transport system permease protein